MNLTLSLLAGLLLLLPGIGAVSAWNQGGREAVRRQELQLTSITALFAVLFVSLISHLATHLVVNVVRDALVQAGDLTGRRYGRIWEDPYIAAFGFTLGVKPAELTQTVATEALNGLALFLAAVLLQSAVVFALVRSDGLDIVFEQMDTRSHGWAFQHIVRPSRHGFVPYARVFTNLTSGDRGVGYEGVVADLRQGADGEIKSLFLAESHCFNYEMKPGRAKAWHGGEAKDPAFVIYDPDEEGEAEGGVALDAAAIRHVILHLVDEEDADDVMEEGSASEDAAEGGSSAA